VHVYFQARMIKEPPTREEKHSFAFNSWLGLFSWQRVYQTWGSWILDMAILAVRPLLDNDRVERYGIFSPKGRAKVNLLVVSLSAAFIRSTNTGKVWFHEQ
jgi:hypothetical protein